MSFESRLLECLCVVGLCACSGAPRSDAPRTGQGAAAGSAANVPPQSLGTAGGAADNPLIAGSSSVIAKVPTQTAQAGHCRAGHYLGAFSGNYRSGAWLDGSDPIVFATSDVDAKPGFEFWLESVSQPCLPGQEFCADAIVKGGKLRGNATPFSDPNDPSTASGAGFSVRFEIDLTGQLDCRTGKFKGKLENGCYDILSVLYRFAGTIDGDYATSSNAFSGGVWHVDETTMTGAAATTTPLGGDGTWSATFKDELTPPSGAGTGLCAGQSGFDTQP